jgi:tubulin-specific chaperone D
VLRTDLVFRAFADPPLNELSELPSLEHPIIVSESSVSDILLAIRQLDVCFDRGYCPREDVVTLAEELLMIWLRQSEKEVVDATTEAAASLMLIVDGQQRNVFVNGWISEVFETNRGRLPSGYIFALTAVFPIVDVQQQDEICEAILQRWRTTSDIKSKIIILQSLTQASLLDSHASLFVNMIAAGLDDYTTDGRGDIGSLVRVEALKAARRAFASIPWDDVKTENGESEPWFRQLDSFSTLYGKVLRLSGEKLDRVRIEAQQTLAQVCRNEV